MRELKPFGTLIILSLLLISCARQYAPQGPAFQKTSWPKRRARLQTLQKWRVQGGLSIQLQDQSQFVHFNWQQTQNHFQLKLFGPLHLGQVSLTGRPGHVTLVRGNQTLKAQSPEQLMQQQLGWYLPLETMQAWIRGLPAKGPYKNKQIDAYGHLRQLHQFGWNIQYLDYQAYRSGQWDLPKRIRLIHGPLKLKIVIQRWIILTTS